MKHKEQDEKEIYGNDAHVKLTGEQEKQNENILQDLDLSDLGNEVKRKREDSAEEVARRQKDTLGLLFLEVFHPIHDQTFYLSAEHNGSSRMTMELNHGLLHKKFEMLFLYLLVTPMALSNPRSRSKQELRFSHCLFCINVALDFVSPENVIECLRLTEELCSLPVDHIVKEDKLQVKKMILNALSQATEVLEKHSRPGRKISDAASRLSLDQQSHYPKKENPKDVCGPCESDSLDDLESTYEEVQSLLKVLPDINFISVDSDSKDIPLSEEFAKAIFMDFINEPLKVLAEPTNEITMIEAISVLNNNLSLFTDEQAARIVKLKDEFPLIVKEWRDTLVIHTKCDEFLSTLENNRSALENLVKTDAFLKGELAQTEWQEEELDAVLKALQGQKDENENLTCDDEELSQKIELLIKNLRKKESEISEKKNSACQKAKQLMASTQEQVAKVANVRTRMKNANLKISILTG
ncbi:hypothetical protein LIER_24087 [Lithospermum erythrorhizon]|uniref:Uncharacterized protein n=1 Tax=Lithospermum erythrorhizon TaxID=34254 RepID=A0AAV3R1C9_LITER